MKPERSGRLGVDMTRETIARLAVVVEEGTSITGRIATRPRMSSLIPPQGERPVPPEDAP
jgi:hypothetical protein